MAAAKGNKNAVGNSGGKSYQDRVLAAEVRRLSLQEIKKVLEGKDTEYKKQLVLKLASTVLPRLNEHAGPEGEPIPIMNVVPANYSNPENPSSPQADSGSPGGNQR